MHSAVAYNRDEIDVLVLDKEGRPAVLAEVKAGSRQRPEDVQSYLQMLRSYADRTQAPYMLLVTPSKIMIWQRNRPSDEPLAALNTPDILQEYQMFGDTTTISGLALEIATKQWLQDLILHWHSPQPPFQDKVMEIGMLEVMKDGEVMIKAQL